MTYRLGIDLGTSSLGWCCLETKDDEVTGLLDIGVRIFPDGRNDKSKDPLCVARREARSARRRLKRFKERQTKLIKDMQESGLLPKDEQTFKSLEKKNPYELRAKAVHEKISLYDLGRAIFHLNQRRGFLSNRQEERKKDTKTTQAMTNLENKIKESGCVTLGEYMYKFPDYRRFKNSTDASGKLVIEWYPNRKMYQDEFEVIWNKQREYYPNILTDALQKRLENDDIFFQRPLKKQETGFCWLEPEERRCPKTHIIAQQFRIWCDISNIRINNNRLLNKEEREALFKLLDNAQRDMYDNDYYVSWDKILECLGLESDTSINLMKAYKKGLLCNITNAILGTQALGESWQKLSNEMKDKVVDILQDYSLLPDEAELKLHEICPMLSPIQTDCVLDQSLILPDGYMNFSEKAMEKLVIEMMNGTDLAMAIENVYHKTAADEGYFDEQDELPPYQELFAQSLIGGDKEKYLKELDYDDYMGRITNVSVHIALNQLRAVVNELIKKYGKPSGITIELGRELTKGKKALASLAKKQKENEKINDEAKKEIKKAGFAVTSFNIEKYKVWRNLNPQDVTKRCDLYTGKPISFSELFTDRYEIEHILPYSWSYDDSYTNKIITQANINRQKLNQLPYEFFNDEKQIRALAHNEEEFKEMSWVKVKERAKDADKANKRLKKTFNFDSMAWRFNKNAREIFNKHSQNLARDLTDMQYMSKLARKYLTCICKKEKIVSAKGQMTDLLRFIWNVNDVLPEDYRLWEPQDWQKKDIIEREKTKLTSEPELSIQEADDAAKQYVKQLSTEEIHNRTRVSKDRSIHYHHALDAFVLANINTKMMQIMSQKDFADEVERQAASHDKTIHEVQKAVFKSKILNKPYKMFDKEELKRRLRDIVVSYKNPVDKLKMIMKKAEILKQDLSQFGFAPICEDTAFGFERILNTKDMSIEFSVKKDGKKKLEKHILSTMVPIFRTKEQKQEFLNLYVAWQKAVVRRKSIGEAAYKAIEESFINSFTKDKAFKWYASAGNYAAQIYQINTKDKYAPNPKENWSLEILPNYYAFERRGKFFWKDIYPTAKLITTLKINDIVEATFDRADELESGFSKIKNWVKQSFENHPDKQQLQLLFRVKKMSGKNIFFRPLHIAQEDNGDVKSWACSIEKFKQYKCHKVSVTPTGQVLRG